ncbi:MAG TPA: hypothetical protein VK936_11700, partial [Longimicrobiales bacterium]|nr:hypothetical protein [Longimicrobiales bacterium]
MHRRRTSSVLTAVLTAVVSTACLATAARAQVPTPTPPPPGTPPDQVQQQIDAMGLRDELLNRLRTSGMTHDQVRRRLASMGYDPATLDAYLSTADSVPPPPTERTFEALRALRLEGMPDFDFVPPDTADLTAEERRLDLRVFGIEVFRRGSTEFEPVATGAVSSSYVLGPGDELVLVLTGDVESVQTLPVTREGFILIP